eukprot:scaffold21592_cov125-Isochrysis_galbana.AAC.6
MAVATVPWQQGEYGSLAGERIAPCERRTEWGTTLSPPRYRLTAPLWAPPGTVSHRHPETPPRVSSHTATLRPPLGYRLTPPP